MIEINLIPDVKRELLRAQRTRSTVISGSILTMFIAGGILVALLVYVYGVQTVRSALLDNSIKTQSEKLAKVEDLSKILTIQNQLDVISTHNDEKKIDSRIFDVLSAIVPPAPNSVQFSQINLTSEDSEISFEGQTRAYDSMEVFKKTLASAVVVYTVDGKEEKVPLATDISTSDVSYGESATSEKILRFTLKFKYAEELFSQNVPVVAIKLNADGNVTDSYLGIPKSIFAPRAEDIQ